MKNWLLVGGAIAALSLSQGVAQAQDFKVTLSGDAQFQASFGGQDKDTGTRSTDFRNRFRFVVNPEAVALNGALTYGAKVRFRAASNTGTTDYDRAFTYVSGAFGTVMAGTNTSYNDDVGAVSAPGDWHPEGDVALAFVQAGYTANGTNLLAWRDDTLDPTGNNTNVRYQSPFISGLQLAVAFTPTARSSGWTFDRSKLGLTNAYEIGLLFDSTDKTIADKFGAALLRASFDYQGGRYNDGANKDLQAFQAGLQAGYAGFTLGGGVVYTGKSNYAKTLVNAADAYTWRLGGQYKMGQFVFGVGYDYAQTDAGSTAAKTEKYTSQQIQTGVNYTVAKGLDVSAEYAYVTTKNTAIDLKDNANVVTLSTKLSF